MQDYNFIFIFGKKKMSFPLFFFQFKNLIEIIRDVYVLKIVVTWLSMKIEGKQEPLPLNNNVMEARQMFVFPRLPSSEWTNYYNNPYYLQPIPIRASASADIANQNGYTSPNSAFSPFPSGIRSPWNRGHIFKI